MNCLHKRECTRWLLAQLLLVGLGAHNTAQALSFSDLNPLKVFKNISPEDTKKPQINNTVPGAPLIPLKSTGTTWAAADDRTCAIDNTGKVHCWGFNPYGNHTPPNDLDPAVQISMNNGRTCVVTSKGEARCWGWGPFNPAGTAGFITQIAPGREQDCALINEGIVSCWINNGSLEKGKFPTTELLGLGFVKHIAAAGSRTCAINNMGIVRCWLNDHHHGTFEEAYSPPADELGFATQIAMAPKHACVINDRKQVKCWGWDGLRQQGPIAVPSDLGPATLVSTGNYHTCAVLHGGLSVRCWGSTFQEFNWSDDVPQDLGFVTQITGGLGYTCASNDRGQLRCWGTNERILKARIPIDLKTVLDSSIYRSSDHSRWSLLDTTSPTNDYDPRPVAQLVYHTKRPIWDGLVGLVANPPDLVSGIIGEYLLIKYLETMQMGQIDQAIEQIFYPDLNRKIKSGSHTLGIKDVSEIANIAPLGAAIYPPILAHMTKFIPSQANQACQSVDGTRRELHTALAKTAANPNDRAVLRIAQSVLLGLLDQIHQDPDCFSTLSEPGDLAGIWQVLNHINRFW